MESVVVKTQEDNNRIYIQTSKTNIDGYICKNYYKKAFALLIMVLERLDNDEKTEIIDYYSKKIYDSIGEGHYPKFDYSLKRSL